MGGNRWRTGQAHAPALPPARQARLKVMINPFLRRATEYVRDDASFLAIVSPSPLTTFLAKNKYKDDMFELTVRTIGAPGCGNTLLPTLDESKMVGASTREPHTPNNHPTAS